MSCLDLNAVSKQQTAQCCNHSVISVSLVLSLEPMQKPMFTCQGVLNNDLYMCNWLDMSSTLDQVGYKYDLFEFSLQEF